MKVTVTMRCIYCKKTREVGLGDVPPGEMPMCECGGVMVAERANARSIADIHKEAIDAVKKAIKAQGANIEWQAIGAIQAYKKVLAKYRIPIDVILTGESFVVKEKEIMELTEDLDEHFEGWEHPCNCALCRSYAE